jgi:hypothetical protein
VIGVALAHDEHGRADDRESERHAGVGEVQQFDGEKSRPGALEGIPGETSTIQAIQTPGGSSPAK